MTSLLDRRLATRRVPHAGEPLARLRLRTGRELRVVDVGAAGALVETDGRLLPGTCVDVHVMTVDGRELVRSRVMRAFVWTLGRDRIVYRGALAFERRIDIDPGYPIPIGSREAPAPQGNAYPLDDGCEVEGGGSVAIDRSAARPGRGTAFVIAPCPRRAPEDVNVERPEDVNVELLEEVSVELLEDVNVER